MTLDETSNISEEFGMRGAMDAAGLVDDDEINITSSATAAQEARDRLADEQREENARSKQDVPKGRADASEQSGPVQGPLPGFTPKYGSRHGIYDEGGYLRVRGLYKVDPRSGQKVVDQDQLRRVLLAVIADKGWTDGIAFYRKNRIDQQMTSAAQSMLATDKALQVALKKRGVGGVSCQQALHPDHPPCWLTTEREKAGHKKRCEQEHIRQTKASIKGLREAEKHVGKGFEKGENGETAKAQLREERRNLEAEVPGVKRTFKMASGLAGDLLGKTGLAAGSVKASGVNAQGPAAPPPPV